MKKPKQKTIEKSDRRIQFRFDPASLSGVILHKKNGFAWRFDLTSAPGIAVGPPDPARAELPWRQPCPALEKLSPLTPSQMTDCEETEKGVGLTFSAWGAHFRITLELCEGPGALRFELVPLPTGNSDLIAAELPGPLIPFKSEGIQVIACYRYQGRLFTGRPGALENETPEAKILRMPDGRHRLRFFGVLGETRITGSAKAGYAAVLEENADAQIVLRQDDHGNLSCSAAWMPSLGTLRYSRAVRYQFEDHSTVVSLCKNFRRYAKANGLFKSLREKIEERPILKKLIGTTACFTGFLQSDANYGGALDQLRKWGHRSFFVFPTHHINFGAQGIEGVPVVDLRPQIEKLKRQDTLLASWIYLSGMAASPALGRLHQKNADGSSAANWRIGDNKWPQVCTEKMYQFLKGKQKDLSAGDGHHFDTTASNALMECYAADHSLDRRGDRYFRTLQFLEASRLGKIVSSEGIKDWAVPFFDIGSNKEIPVATESSAYRVFPIQHLVYHDSIFCLWWEADGYDVPHWMGGDLDRQSITDILYGDMPLISPVGRSYCWAKGAVGQAVIFDQTLQNPLSERAAHRAVEVARRFKSVATDEMVSFEWLTDDGAVQRTAFSTGVSVTANFGTTPYALTKKKVLKPLEAH